MFQVLEEEGIGFSFLKSENRMRLTETSSEIIFRSLDDFERLRGTNLAWFGCDELTYCKRESWMRLLARLRDPKARRLCGFACWTPKGFDWVYEAFVSDPKPDYKAYLASPRENFHTTADFYDQLAVSYDERFFRQEGLGEYLNIFSGQAYYSFDRHRSIEQVEYNPQFPLCWSLDFNIDPMCSVIAQVEDRTTRHDQMMNYRNFRINVLDELYLRDCNTVQACEEFVNHTEKYRSSTRPIQVICYGDASGSARQTASAGSRSDWQTVREYFARHPGYVISYRYKPANPMVKDRIAAVNGALCNSVGERRLFIHPQCKNLQRDLERVAWSEGSAQLDKKTDAQLTHISDALGYLVETEMPVRQTASFRKEMLV
jgi:hypothetical protein